MTVSKQKHGGNRIGSGRKLGSKTSLEETTVIRIPTSQKPYIQALMTAYTDKKRSHIQKGSLDTVSQIIKAVIDNPPIELPLYASKVPAGFPSPADDHVEELIDPTRYLVDQAHSTFFVTIQGESMIEVGLMPGDKAVVDKSKDAKIGDIILASIDGEFTIKKLSKQKNGNPKLLPANSSGNYKPILIQESTDFEIWGVVTGLFKRFK